MSKNVQVNNGSRPLVDLGDYEGLAGLVERGDGLAELAYMPNRRGKAPTVGDVIDVGQQRFRIVRREESHFVPGMYVLAMTADTAA